jgi:hypothetical protein
MTYLGSFRALMFSIALSTEHPGSEAKNSSNSRFTKTTLPPHL